MNEKTNMESTFCMLENFVRSQQSSLKSLFSRSPSFDRSPNAVDSPKLIPQLSPPANSIVSRCSRILQISTEELQNRFETEQPENLKQSSVYARNFLEFCSFQALHLVTQQHDYLSNKDFARFTYDIMLAWEAPSAEGELQPKETAACNNNQEAGDEDGWSLFYSSPTNMALQVDEKKSVGQEAFTRIAPVSPSVADIITVHNLFDALTNTSGHRLHFLIYDKYLRSLDRVIKAAKNVLVSPSISNYQLVEGEIILDVDGSIPIQPVFQHIGISAWPGRLTLTNYGLYFEPLGVGLYDKPVRYDLATEMKQVIKPELTGPLGARLFDKAVMYKSTSVVEPVFWEFPEFNASSRRDYWLDICLEVLHAHKFIRKYNFKGIQRLEALSRAILGIFRCRVIREEFHIFSSQYQTLLAFNLAESLPRGDLILETLSSRLAFVNGGSPRCNAASSPHAKRQLKLSPVLVWTLKVLGFVLQKEEDADDETNFPVGDVSVGETNLLEMAVRQSIQETGKAEAAKATVDQVKVEGIDTNLAVMKELLFPVIASANSLQFFTSWEDPFKSTVFLLLSSYMIIRGWIRYIFPFFFVILAALMLWNRHWNKGKPLESFKVTPPPTRNAVEQLLTLQDAISRVESLIKTGNIILLKMRALVFAILPQATDKVALLLVLLAALLAFVPFRCLILLLFLEIATREMPLRKDSSERWVRRVREWWVRVPAAPVRLVKPEGSKKRR